MFPSFYHEILEKYLTPAQLLTLQMLVWLLQSQKQVRIERLAATLPLPILQSSRRRHIQRFLQIKALSILVLWFPIVKQVISRQIATGSQLVVALDRTQWKEYNVLMVSAIVQKRAFPIFWILLDKDGASNLTEQQQVLRPVIRLLKRYKLVIVGDREFHSIELAQWLHRQHLSFVLRQKCNTTFREKRQPFQSLDTIPVKPGIHLFYPQIGFTQKKGFSRFNLVASWKRKYRGNQEDEPWYLLTNLPDLKSAIGVYSKRYGIEAMFKDCKTGGYNLEGCQASPEKLIALIILIAMAMTEAWLRGKRTQLQGQEKYVCRPQEPGRNRRRHSKFWIGLYGENWLIACDCCREWLESMMGLVRNKQSFYQRGLKAIKLIEQPL
ncbi:IS4 family transposase [Microcoleus vaginatus]|uniref:IS4 family transposase n=1 Tax=Microcoleus vaginatus TaxID=119532 RepID=UPI001689C2D8|nr:IS4 family transposase [Microcoleus sp. FACHB-84]MBD2009886.1 IS4 family transposase [Microcoleus sp. FACHB-45]